MNYCTWSGVDQENLKGLREDIPKVEAAINSFNKMSSKTSKIMIAVMIVQIIFMAIQIGLMITQSKSVPMR